MIARREGQEARRGGTHARREDQRFRAALEGRQRCFGLIEGRIVGARVDAAGAVAIVLVAQVGARHMDRRHHGLGEGIDPTHGLGGERSGGNSLLCHAIIVPYTKLTYERVAYELLTQKCPYSASARTGFSVRLRTSD